MKTLKSYKRWILLIALLPVLYTVLKLEMVRAYVGEVVCPHVVCANTSITSFVVDLFDLQAIYYANDVVVIRQAK